MAWQKLAGETPIVTVRSNGKIEWNDEANLQLKDPECVELFYDSETNRLGLRGVCIRSTQGVFVAHLEEDNLHQVDADYELDTAGIKPEEDIEGELSGPTVSDEGEGEAGIFWLDLGS